MKLVALACVLSLAVWACGTGADAATAPFQCEVTVPDTGFIPPGKHPGSVPDRYGSAWYGTPDLWTTLALGGERWYDLPVHDDRLGQKLFFFSQAYLPEQEPMPDIIVRAKRLDGPGEATSAMPATNGSHPDLGSFAVTGIELPSAGCWQLTASYRGAQLTYVVDVSA